MSWAVAIGVYRTLAKLPGIDDQEPQPIRAVFDCTFNFFDPFMRHLSEGISKINLVYQF
jgi:hypothetical protein